MDHHCGDYHTVEYCEAIFWTGIGWGLRLLILALLAWAAWSLLTATYRWIRRHTR